MGPADALLVAGAGVLAGAVNAVAGGGTLITFPALLATGMPALTANITSSVGLVTGYAGGALGYRRELRGQRNRLRQLGPAALLGGIVGAVILLITPSDGFKAAVPYLVLLSCVLLAAQTRLAALVARRRLALALNSQAQTGNAQTGEAQATSKAPDSATAGTGQGGDAAPGGPQPSGGTAAPAPTKAAVAVTAPSTPSAPVAGQAGAQAPPVPAAHPITWPTRIGVFLAGVYGSYFGAGLGVLLLGVLGILVVDELQRTNALKTLLSFGVNLVGVVIFLVTAKVSWGFAGILVVTSTLGGLLGARVARLLPAPVLRGAVITLGLVVAIVLLIRN